MINAAIIGIGDELLLGETINTNSAWLGKQLTSIGINVNVSVVISDSELSIINSLDLLSKDNEIIITTGGLGPTNDDITKKAVAKYFDVNLIEDSKTVSTLKEYMTRRGREVTNLHLEQALLPSCSKALSNKVGTAPGIFTQMDDKLFFNLPGVPLEMKSIFVDNIKNILIDFKLKSKNDYFVYKTIYTTGIVESEIAKRISSLETENDDIRFAYLPSYSGVRIRIGTLNSELIENKSMLSDIEDKIKHMLNTYIIEEEKPILNAILEYFSNNNLTISVAESCTGGGLGALLSGLPGSSNILLGGFIVYSNKSKINLLNVETETLDKFGAVSKETAIRLAENCKKKLNSNIAISITGIAGPDGGNEDKPVGTVWIGVADEFGTYAKKFVFLKNREANRELSKFTALSLIYRKLKYNIEIQ